MRRMPRSLVLIAVVMLVLGLGAGALAQQNPQPTPQFPPEGIDQTQFILLPYEARAEAMIVKERLYDYGYYPSFFSDKSALQNSWLDVADFAALQECCQQNDLEYSEYGLLFPTYEAIKNGDIINRTPNVTAAPAYHLIVYGESSSDVGKIQSKLQSLNYKENYAINIYDAALRDALDRFIKANNYNYDQYAAGGITPELQEWLFTSDGLLPYVEPEVTPEPTAAPTPVPGGVERLQNYFTGSTAVFGLKLPTLALWLAGIVILVLIFLAIFHFFGPGQGKARKNDENVVSFDISYRGQMQTYNCIIPKVLRIGRNIGSFPLNMEDTSISRRHCELYYQNGQLVLHDYSSYGTQVNGRLIHNSECKLNSGDTLQIGDHIIRITFTEKGK